MKKDIQFSSKTEYRVYAKKIRNELDIKDISSKIAQTICNQDFYRFSENILCFYPINNEIDLTTLFLDNSKNWFLPRIDELTRGLIINKYIAGNQLVKSKWGVYEPCCDLESFDINKIDIAIIPALMIDGHGHRLGYGAGFYDRFIPGLRENCLKIVPLPEELVVSSLPRDHWDIPVNCAITQFQIIKF